MLDAAFGAAQAVVVLQTPDDVAYLHESLTYVGDPECTAQLQPRPNVLFEAGMAPTSSPISSRRHPRHGARPTLTQPDTSSSYFDLHNPLG